VVLSLLVPGVVSCSSGGENGNIITTDTATVPDETTTVVPDVTEPDMSVPDGAALVCSGDLIPGNNGATYPFQGLTSHGYTFSCTTCPTGLAWLTGNWVFYNGSPANEDNFTDVLYFDGNNFIETLVGIDEGTDPNNPIEATVKGYYFCPPESEQPQEMIMIWVVTDVDPPGAFGNSVGDAYPLNIMETIAGTYDDTLLWFDFDWEGSSKLAPGNQFTYCKPGANIEGETCMLP